MTVKLCLLYRLQAWYISTNLLISMKRRWENMIRNQERKKTVDIMWKHSQCVFVHQSKIQACKTFFWRITFVESQSLPLLCWLVRIYESAFNGTKRTRIIENAHASRQSLAENAKGGDRGQCGLKKAYDGNFCLTMLFVDFMKYRIDLLNSWIPSWVQFWLTFL